jgi:hypothetical protein
VKRREPFRARDQQRHRHTPNLVATTMSNRTGQLNWRTSGDEVDNVYVIEIMM